MAGLPFMEFLLLFALAPLFVPLGLMLGVIEVLFPVVRNMDGGGSSWTPWRILGAWLVFAACVMLSRWIVRKAIGRGDPAPTTDGAR